MRALPILLLAGLLAVSLAAPAAAQYRELVPQKKETPPGERPPPPPKTDAQEMDEVIITPRSVPNYDEYDAFQREEFEKIRARYEKPPPAEPQGDAALSTEAMKAPQDRTEARAMMREGPRLRDIGED